MPFLRQRAGLLPATLLCLPLLACNGGIDREVSDDSFTPPDGGALQTAARDVLQGARQRDEINGYALEIGTADETYARIAGGNIQRLEAPTFIASAGKPVAAAVILSLVEDAGLIFPINPSNRLRLDEPIATYLSGTAAGQTQAAQEVTLRQLLNHTSGLPTTGCIDGDNNTEFTLLECATQVLEAGSSNRGSFAYGAGSYHVAGAVAEAFAGQDWQSLVDERIAEPLGIALPFSPEENPRIAGGIRTSLKDLATFQRAALTRDPRILSEDSYALMRQSQTSTAGGRLPGVTADRYAFGFWLEAPGQLPDGTAGPELSSPGLFGTVPWTDDDRGYYAVLVLRPSLSGAQYQTGLALMREIRAEILARLP